MICFRSKGKNMNVEAQMSSGPISATGSKALCSTDGIVIVICTRKGVCACVL